MPLIAAAHPTATAPRRKPRVPPPVAAARNPDEDEAAIGADIVNFRNLLLIRVVADQHFADISCELGFLIGKVLGLFLWN